MFEGICSGDFVKNKNLPYATAVGPEIVTVKD
jgi:hypothetical protein